MFYIIVFQVIYLTLFIFSCSPNSYFIDTMTSSSFDFVIATVTNPQKHTFIYPFLFKLYESV